MGKTAVGVVGIGRAIGGRRGLPGFGEPPLGVIFVGQRRPASSDRSAVARDVAGGVIAEAARRPARGRD